MANPATIIERLGGPEVLAPRLDISLKAIEQWVRRNRIPSKRYVELLDLAKERRVRLSLQELSTQSHRVAA